MAFVSSLSTRCGVSSLVFGAVPGCIALYYRLTIPETPRYTFDVKRDVEKAGEDTKAYMQGKAEGKPDEIRRIATIQVADQGLEVPKASWGDFFRHYSKWRHAKILIGYCGLMVLLGCGLLWSWLE